MISYKIQASNGKQRFNTKEIIMKTNINRMKDRIRLFDYFISR